MSSTPPLRVLAFSPYHGGSHAQFLDEWAARSRHDFVALTLPPRHFKWRIRQASVGLADAAAALAAEGEQFDVIWTTSMLDAAELRGLLPASYRAIPLVVYFHENQLVYPVRREDERNQHFSLINWASALAADEVWFNSAFNRDSMLGELATLLRKMPDENSLPTVERIERKSRVESVGIVSLIRTEKSPGPLHLGWVGRWEHDKRPDRFFRALDALRSQGVDFRVTVLGQSFRTAPPEFETARTRLARHIEHFGFVPDRAEYERLLAKCDVVVSTADHEFFGVALLEGVSGGAIPLVPNRLVYPEIYPQECLYESEAELVEKCISWSRRKSEDSTLATLFDAMGLNAILERYNFEARAVELDDALWRCVHAAGN